MYSKSSTITKIRVNFATKRGMSHTGEIIALLSAVSCTATALYASEASSRLGSMTVNVIRLLLATVFLSASLWIVTGSPFPAYSDGRTWLYLTLSALVGYVFGDYCLFNSYLVIGPKTGQLFMTLAPPIAAIAGWMMLGETMSWMSWIAMGVTISGIAISILSKEDDSKVHLDIPLKGILLGIGAGVGQGVGLVLSKIGMNHYSMAIPADAPAMTATMLPFASTMIRALTGCLGFLLTMVMQRHTDDLKAAVKDGKGMKYAALTTLFGPVIGVSLSLMAVRYTETGVASTLMALTPVLIIIPYSIIYKQKISLKEIIGVLVSMTGVAMFFML